MQKYGFTFKTVTIDQIKISLFPQIFSIFLILIIVFKILSSTVVYIYAVYAWVGLYV